MSLSSVRPILKSLSSYHTGPKNFDEDQQLDIIGVEQLSSARLNCKASRDEKKNLTSIRNCIASTTHVDSDETHGAVLVVTPSRSIQSFLHGIGIINGNVSISYNYNSADIIPPPKYPLPKVLLGVFVHWDVNRGHVFVSRECILLNL